MPGTNLHFKYNVKRTVMRPRLVMVDVSTLGGMATRLRRYLERGTEDFEDLLGGESIFLNTLITSTHIDNELR